MTNEEAAQILRTEWSINAEIFDTSFFEALELAIKALEFQDRFTDIIAQAVVNSGCDSLEEFCEKIGVHNEEAKDEGGRVIWNSLCQ